MAAVRRYSPLMGLLFVLCVCQGILSNLKDAVTLSYHPSGAAAMPFIQLCALLPAAVVVTFLFTRLSRYLGKSIATRLLIAAFMVFLLLFAFVLFPQMEALRLKSLALRLSLFFPTRFETFFELIDYWPLTVFYVGCELWAPVTIALLFWGWVHDIVPASEAADVYGPLQFGATTSAVFSGVIANLLIQENFSTFLPFGSTAWEQTLIKQVLFVVACGIVALFLLRHLTSRIGPHEEKQPISLTEGVRLIRSSPYLGCITILVFGYVIVNLSGELVWKAHLHEAYPDPNGLLALMNNLLPVVGGFSMLLSLLIPYAIKKLGWTFLVLVTPCLLLVTNVGLFSSLLFSHSEFMVIFFGAVQSCLGKATKYSVFDVAKEMAYSPLPSDVKWAAKATIDGIGRNLGVTVTCISQQMMIMSFGGVMACAPFLGVLVISTLFVWILAGRRAGADYERLRQGVPVF